MVPDLSEDGLQITFDVADIVVTARLPEKWTRLDLHRHGYLRDFECVGSA